MMMQRKSVILGVIIILVSGFLTPGFSMASSSHIILYVDDDNLQGPWDGTLEHPYQHIQDAIDNASDHDTIRVHAGKYLNGEAIVITKPLQVVGNGSDLTHIECPVRIVSDDVVLSGFTIRGFNSKQQKLTYCIQANAVHNCTIRGNNFSEGLNALEIECADQILFENNSISIESVKPIVYLFSCDHVIIRGITITAITYGVYLDQCHSVFVERNTFSSPSEEQSNLLHLNNCQNSTIERNTFLYCGDSISLYSSNHNRIQGNIFKNTSGGAILLDRSQYNIISQNEIHEALYGVIHLNSGSDNNIIENNNLSGNSGASIGVYDSNNVIIRKNIIAENNPEGFGIIVYGNGNIIECNKIIKNGYGGIYIEESSNTLIMRNLIQQNGNSSLSWSGGIEVVMSRKNIIKWNNIENNENFGLMVTACLVNARFNWWGSPQGPNTVRHHSEGQNIVSQGSFVQTFPWLLFPYNIEWAR